jgi:2-methylcitrate dehydratase PrpD
MKAYEIQGCFQIRNAFNKVGLDHTILVKIASTTVVSWLLGLSEAQTLDALSQAWMDGAHFARIANLPTPVLAKAGLPATRACVPSILRYSPKMVSQVHQRCSPPLGLLRHLLQRQRISTTSTLWQLGD